MYPTRHGKQAGEAIFSSNLLNTWIYRLLVMYRWRNLRLLFDLQYTVKETSVHGDMSKMNGRRIKCQVSSETQLINFIITTNLHMLHRRHTCSFGLNPHSVNRIKGRYTLEELQSNNQRFYYSKNSTSDFSLLPINSTCSLAPPPSWSLLSLFLLPLPLYPVTIPPADLPTSATQVPSSAVTLLRASVLLIF